MLVEQITELSPGVIGNATDSHDHDIEMADIRAAVEILEVNNVSLIKELKEAKGKISDLESDLEEMRGANWVLSEDNDRLSMEPIDVDVKRIMDERDHFQRKMIEFEEINLVLSEKISELASGFSGAGDTCDPTGVIKVPVEYDSLGEVLSAALHQAAIGKGKERHANDEPFEEQDICAITRSEGHGFTRGQAIKKIKEAKRLDREAAIRELLGAINYLAADIIVLGEVA